MSEHFLVTGCAGFIGGAVVRLLLSKGYKVRGVDDFSTGLRSNIERFGSTIEFMEGDISDFSLALKACKSVDRIIHLASIPSVARSLVDPLASVRSSVMSSVALFHAAHQSGVKRIVQAGSSSVYGASQLLPKEESHTPLPMSPYAASKLAQENYAHAFWCCFKLEVVTLRLFNVYGGGQNPNGDYAAVIPRFIVKMLNGEVPTIYGDGNQSRDFTYVEDVAEAFLQTSVAKRELGAGVYNAARGDESSLLDLVEQLNMLLGTNITPNFETARVGDVRHSRGNPTRLREAVGYYPLTSFADGLRKTVSYYRG